MKYLLIVALIFLHVSPAFAARKKAVQSEAGLHIPKWGIAVDAVYDRRLDELIPGYKIVNIVLTNRSPSVIRLDPHKDRWVIIDHLGKSHHAINHVRFISDALWASLPPAMQDKLDYPHAVQVGNSTKIDVLFPSNIELLNFREVGWRSFHFKKDFTLYTNMEKELDDSEKAGPAARRTRSLDQAIEKYEGDWPVREIPSPKDRRPDPRADSEVQLPDDANMDTTTIPLN